MKFFFLGGAGEIGASCILVKIKNKNILLDCGIRQGANKDTLPDFRTIQEQGGVDAIIISHAHMDHIGALPLISKEYPLAKIYMNNMTKDLCKVLLQDSLKIMNSREAEIPLYIEQDVENMLNRVFTLNYELEFEILEGIKLTFYNAGHIAGASCTYILGDEGAVFYSGDFSIFSQKTVSGAKLPKLRPDVAILEATYGDKLHSNREVEEEKLINIVNECINKGGKILIPSFALGRAQEVLLILKKAINTGRVKKIPIYVDGMVKDINRVYKLNPLYLNSSLGKKVLKGIEPFYDDNVRKVDKKELREEIIKAKESCIIVASSGMLTGGPSQFYAEKIIAMEEGCIVISGYQDEESPGRKLLSLLECDEKERAIQINERVFPVKCRVEKVGLSAHGDKNEIKAVINRLTPKNIFLVHGEEGVVQGLSKELALENLGRIYAPKSGEEVQINVKIPRKQLKKQFPYLLNYEKDIEEEDLEKLWSFVLENYSESFFTVEELLILWKGSAKLKEESIGKLQKLLLNSIYFENDLRRFFKFKGRRKEEVEEDLKPKELKPNQINEYIKEFIYGYDYKKAGIKQEEKKVILYFDFPKAVSSSIYEKIKAFEEKTNWHMEINENTNINALEGVLRGQLTGVEIKKISYLLGEGKVIVTTEGECEDLEKAKEEFKSITALELCIKNSDKEAVIESKDMYVKSNNPCELEQNAALNYIDESFRNESFAPYKKSIKSGLESKYIELTFISPVIGKRYEEKLKEIAENTGWNMAIGKSANQNQILTIAVSLFRDKGVSLNKNPSFNPSNYVVEIKAEDIKEEIFESIKKEFDEKTGCSLRRK